jgi:hypothetical protein
MKPTTESVNEAKPQFIKVKDTHQSLANGAMKHMDSFVKKIQKGIQNGEKFEISTIVKMRNILDAIENQYGIKESTPDQVIKDLDKAKNDLLKKVDALIVKKKKLYSDVDIEAPMSSDEKKLDKDIADLFSQINKLVLQKRSVKKESVNEEQINELSADTYKNTVKAALQRGDSKGNSIAVKALQSFGKEIAKELAGKSFEVKGSMKDVTKALYKGSSYSYINQVKMTFTGEGSLIHDNNVRVFGSDEAHFNMNAQFQLPDNIGGFSSDVKFRGYQNNKIPATIQFSIKGGKVWVWFKGADTDLEFTRAGAREMAKLADTIVTAMDFPTKAKHNTIKQFDAMKPTTESVNESKLSFSQLKKGQVLLNKFRSGRKYTIIDVDSKSATLKNLQTGNTIVIYSLNNYELKESVNEGSMSDIDIMAQEAPNFKEFVKEFYKEFRDFPKTKDSIKWLLGIYNGRTKMEGLGSDGLERVAQGLPQTEEEPINEESLSDLEKSLKSHDWWYAYSDDSRRYNSGERNWNSILRMIKSLKGKEAEKLWNKYVPKDFNYTYKKLSEGSIDEGMFKIGIKHIIPLIPTGYAPNDPKYKMDLRILRNMLNNFYNERGYEKVILPSF